MSESMVIDIETNEQKQIVISIQEEDNMFLITDKNRTVLFTLWNNFNIVYNEYFLFHRKIYSETNNCSMKTILEQLNKCTIFIYYLINNDFISDKPAEDIINIWTPFSKLVENNVIGLYSEDMIYYLEFVNYNIMNILNSKKNDYYSKIDYEIIESMNNLIQNNSDSLLLKQIKDKCVIF